MISGAKIDRPAARSDQAEITAVYPLLSPAHNPAHQDGATRARSSAAAADAGICAVGVL
jgi:hypothetical protein